MRSDIVLDKSLNHSFLATWQFKRWNSSSSLLMCFWCIDSSGSILYLFSLRKCIILCLRVLDREWLFVIISFIFFLLRELLRWCRPYISIPCHLLERWIVLWNLLILRVYLILQSSFTTLVADFFDLIRQFSWWLINKVYLLLIVDRWHSILQTFLSQALTLTPLPWTKLSLFLGRLSKLGKSIKFFLRLRGKRLVGRWSTVLLFVNLWSSQSGADKLATVSNASISYSVVFYIYSVAPRFIDSTLSIPLALTLHWRKVPYFAPSLALGCLGLYHVAPLLGLLVTGIVKCGKTATCSAVFHLGRFLVLWHEERAFCGAWSLRDSIENALNPAVCLHDVSPCDILGKIDLIIYHVLAVTRFALVPECVRVREAKSVWRRHEKHWAASLIDICNGRLIWEAAGSHNVIDRFFMVSRLWYCALLVIA